MDPRPFTVIGGFLGVGKTTLVNQILAGAEGVRYAVLVNDFGAVNVDAGLIAKHDGRTMALTNGCICCSLSDGLVTTMLRLMQEPESFDHVIVEASGVALPDRIMDFARIDPMLTQDAVVVLVDAETVSVRLEDRRVGEVVAAQIESADIVLVTKLDLDGAASFSTVEAIVRAIAPDATILRGDPLGLVGALLGTGLARVTEPKHHHVHTSFHTLTLQADTPVTREAFERFAKGLPSSILRGKGRVLMVEEGGVLWQRVGMRMETVPLNVSVALSEIVLIGTEPFLELANVPTGMKPFE